MITLFQMISDGSVVQFLITVLLTLTVCLLVLNGKTVPVEIKDPFILVLGFYFGSKVQSTVNKYRVSNTVQSDE